MFVLLVSHECSIKLRKAIRLPVMYTVSQHRISRTSCVICCFLDPLLHCSGKLSAIRLTAVSTLPTIY